jgi:AAA15 family ATPase/GTPase
MKVFLENIRSLINTGAVPLKPLTLLLGENSTGKTTFLAMLSYLSENEFPSIHPNFNAAPFDLGTYDSGMLLCCRNPVERSISAPLIEI